MTLRLNNLKDGHYNQVFLLNTTSNVYEEVRTLISAGGGGGSGTVSSATTPLSIDANGVISIDLTGYSLSSALTQALLLGVGNVTHTHDFQSPTITIASGGNSKALSLNAGGYVQIGNDQIIDAQALGNMNFINSLLTTASSPLTITQNPNNYSEYTIETPPWKPTNISLGSGLQASNISDANGTITISPDTNILQTKLNTVTEVGQNITYAAWSNDPGGFHIVWNTGASGGSTDVTNSHQEITVPYVYIYRTNLPTSGGTFLEFEVSKTHSLTQLVIAVNDGTWGSLKEWEVTNITSTWQKFSVNWVAFASGNCDLFLGYTTHAGNSSYVQASGTIGIRNVRLWGGTPAAKTTIGNDLLVNGPLSIADPNQVYRELTSDLNGNLLWDGNAVGSGSGGVTTSVLNTAIATQIIPDPSKPGVTTLGNSGTGQLLLGIDTANICDWTTANTTFAPISSNLSLMSQATSGSATVLLQSPVTWQTSGGSYQNFTGYQEITVPMVYKSGFTGLPTNQNFTLSFEVQAGTTSTLTVDAFSGAWTSFVEWQMTGLSTSSWTTFSQSWSGFSSGALHIHLGLSTANYGGTYTQPSGSLKIRNLQLSYGTSSTVTCNADLQVNGNVSATGTVSSSDRNIKTNITDIDEAACLQMLDAVNPKTYQRTDLQNQISRVGFIAQDIQESSNEKWQNLTMYLPGDEPKLGMDYSRLTAILWSVCKNQEARIKALESN